MNKLHYHRASCPDCGGKYDSVLPSCPNCGAENADESAKRSWKECTPVGPWRELFCFLFGFLGLQIIQIIIQLIVVAVIASDYRAQGLSGNELNDAVNAFFNTGRGLAAIFFPLYSILFVGFIVALWKYLPRLARKFANPKTYVGVIFVVVIYAFDIIYGMLIAQFTGGQSNQNQSNVNSILTAYPALSILILGLIGPFCEECTYRLGLFNVLKRWNTIAAYVLSALIFGAIHFNWANIASPIEWLNLPPYIVSGLLLGLAYDKFGFGASYLAHALNNTVSCILSIVNSKAS